MPAKSRRAPLTRDAVMQAALALADEGGVATLSMRRLAEKLGIEAMSLYHHVANKEAILDGLVDLVFAEIELPTVDAGWTTAMRERAHSARTVLRGHPWAISLMDSRANPGMATLRHHDAVIGCLRGGGFSVAGAAHAFSVLDSYIYGFVLQEVALPFENTEDLEEIGADILEQMPTDAFPHLTELMQEHALQPGYAYAEEFDYGLELILDGLRRAIDARP